VKKTLARHINEIQTQSSQENYGDITTHSPEYAGPSSIKQSILLTMKTKTKRNPKNKQKIYVQLIKTISSILMYL
jgi:hypothetical protein